jgi:hypothetical protein
LIRFFVSLFPKTESVPNDAKKRIRDEQIEALVRDRDAAVQKAKTAEAECLRWKSSAEAANTLQTQVESLQESVRRLERLQFDSRNFEVHISRAVTALEHERDLLLQELLRVKNSGGSTIGRSSSLVVSQNADLSRASFPGHTLNSSSSSNNTATSTSSATTSGSATSAVNISVHNNEVMEKALYESEQEVQRLRFQNIEIGHAIEEMKREFEDRLDAERILNAGLKKECALLRGMTGTGFEELRVKMESGLHLALQRVDHMESLLHAERAKSKKYLKLLMELVEKDDLDVLLADDADESNQQQMQQQQHQQQDDQNDDCQVMEIEQDGEEIAEEDIDEL